jgi:hypothetical protein
MPHGGLPWCRRAASGEDLRPKRVWTLHKGEHSGASGLKVDGARV